MPDFPPGTPSWVDLSSPDADASAAFYGAIMGWTASESGPVEETGGYRMFEQDGKRIAGLMPHVQEDQPTAWATYVSVADADETGVQFKHLLKTIGGLAEAATGESRQAHFPEAHPEIRIVQSKLQREAECLRCLFQSQAALQQRAQME